MRVLFLLAVPLLMLAGLVVGAPTAAAECITVGNMTMCSVGPEGYQNSGPYMPYPCEYDYYCNDNYGSRDLF